MAENHVSGISKVDLNTSQASQIYQAYQAYKAQNQREKVSQSYEKSPETAAIDPEVEKRVSKLAPGLGMTTALRFEVNSETKDLVVMVVDKATEKVISTIPPEAIKDIPVGDLMQYSI